MISRIWKTKRRARPASAPAARNRRLARRQRPAVERLEPRAMLAVSVLTPVTPGINGYFNAAAQPLALSAGVTPATNTVEVKLSAVALAGFGNTVIADVTINGGAPVTYYNYANSVSFAGWTSDIANSQDNQITLTSMYGVDLAGDTTGGSSLKWAANADFSLSALGVSSVAFSLNGADALTVNTGAGPSIIAGKIDSPTATPGKANALITYSTNGKVTIDGANVYGGVDTYDLTIADAPGAAASAIVLNGTINVQHDVTLRDGHPIVVAQAITAGNAVSIAATAITTNAAITAKAATVNLNAVTGLNVNDDVVANGAITLVGNTGVTTAAKADVTSAVGAVSVTSANGSITTAGAITATTNAVTLTTLPTGLDVVTTGTITALSAVTVTANRHADIGAAVAVTGVNPGAGALKVAASAGNVIVRPVSPLTVVDGKVDVVATAGTVELDALVASNLAVTVTAGQGVTLSNALDPTAGITTTGTGGTITITNGSNQVLVDAPVAALGDAVVVTCASDDIAVRDDVTGLGNVTFTAKTPVNIGGLVTPITLTSTTGTIAATSTTAEVTLNNNLALVLPGLASGLNLTAATLVTVPIAVTAGGSVAITSPNGFTVGQPITAVAGTIAITSAGGTVSSTLPTAALAANGNVTLSGKAGVTVDRTVSSATGGVDLTSTGGDVTIGAGTILSVPDAGGGRITVVAGGAFNLGIGLTSGNNINVTAGATFTPTTDFTSATGSVTILVTNGGLNVGGSTITALGAGGSVSLSAPVGFLTVNLGAIFTVGGLTLIDGLGQLPIGPLTVGGNLVVKTGGAWVPTGNIASAGGGITVTAVGAIDVGSVSLAAPAGSISLTSTLAGINVGAAPNLLTVNPATGSITLDAATSVAIAQDLVAGDSITISSSAPLVLANTLTATVGSVDLTSSAGGVAINAAVAAGAAVTATGLGAVTNTAALTATTGSVTLTSTGAGVSVGAAIVADVNVVATGLGTVTNTAALTATTGSVTLTSTGAGVSMDDVIVAGANVVATGVGAVTNTAALTATTGSVTLTSTGAGVSMDDVIVAGANVVATGVGAVTNTAALTATTGSVTLTSTGAGVAMDDVIVAGLAIQATAFKAVVNTASLTAGNDITLTSTGLLPTDGVGVGGDLTAGGTITLTASNVIGDQALANTITKRITADVLIATAPGVASLLFTNPANDVNSLSIVLPSGIDVEWFDVDDLTVTAITTVTGSVSVDAGAWLAVTGAIGAPGTITGITLTATGFVTVGGSLQADLADPITGVADITVTSVGGDVIVSGSITASKGGIELSSGGGTTGAQIGTKGQPGGNVFALNDISVTGVTGVAVLGTGPAPTIQSAAGDITLASGKGPVTVEADVLATTGAVDVSGAGAIALTGSTIFAGGGDVSISGTFAGAITSSASISAPANSILISTAGLITFTGGALGAALTYSPGPPAAGLVSIDGALGVTVTTSPTITCGRLEIDSGSVLPIGLTAAGNDVDSLRVMTKGNFTYSQTAGLLEINDPESGGVRSIQVQSVFGNVTISSTAGLRVVDGISWGPAGALSLSAGGAGVEFVTTDDGDNAGMNLPFQGTLRDMLGYVNANTATNGANSNAAMQLVFDEPIANSKVAGTGTITLGTVPLPAITKVVTFNGALALAPDSVGGNVYIDGGTVVPATANGLTLGTGSGGSVIENVGIHGFKSAAIDVSTGSNVFRGLVLGANRAGAAKGNGFGIRIAGASAAAPASGNVIGVRTAGDAGNVIVSSTYDGISIGANAPYTGIYGNSIGVLQDVARTARGNGRHGISVQSSIGTQIGTSTALYANDIGNSGQDGVFIADVTGSSIVYGVQVVGNTIFANAASGVRIRGGGRNLVGGSALNAGNEITGSPYGIYLLQTTGTTPTHDNVVVGNTVSGLLFDGTGAPVVVDGQQVRAGQDGIRVERSYSNQVVGNTVSGNAKRGIVVDTAQKGTGFAIANRILGNTVSANGDAATNGGIVVINSANQIVGMTGAGNVVRSNTGSGIVVDGTSSTGNSVTDNVVTGGAVQIHGVVVSAGTGNVVRRNTTSGNVQAGIAVLDAFATTAANQNTVAANTTSGNGYGILVSGGRYQTIGGTLASDGNVVFSNRKSGTITGDGILVVNSANGQPQNVAIRNNRIGVNGSSAAGNDGFGIRIESGSSTVVDFANIVRNNASGGISVKGGSTTVIGSPVAGRGNTISGNGDPVAHTGNGILIQEPDTGSMPLGVTIAGNVIQGNAADGVGVTGARASGVVIGRDPSITQPNGTGNLITGNYSAGIRVVDAQRVTMIGNSIASNGAAPIVLANAATNGGVKAPTLTSRTPRVGSQSQPQWDIRGQVTGTAAGQTFYVDLYMDVRTGGQAYMGRVLVKVGANKVGTFRVVMNGPAGGLGAASIRATSTAASGTLFGDTSSFSV